MKLVSIHTPGAGERGDRLRRLIGRKRSEKQRLEREIGEARRGLAELDALRRGRLAPLDREVHEHFERILASRRFDAGDRAEIAGFYKELIEIGALSTPGQTSSACPCPRCAGAAPPSDERERRGPAAAPRPPVEMRELYHALAERFHPDKARDEATRQTNEELMREINGAYRTGDLDALAALSAELGFEIAGDAVLETLAGQYEQLKAEVRALRRDPLGEMVVEARRCQRQGCLTPLAELEAELHDRCADLAEIAGLFRAHRSGEITDAQLLDELLWIPGDAEEEGSDPTAADRELLEVMITLAEALRR